MTDLLPGWEWTTIGDVAGIQLGRQRSPKNHAGPHMRPYLRSANVTWSGIDVSDVKKMNFDPGEAAIFELHPGDLLLNEASGSPNEVGKPAIWRGEIEGCCFQNTLLRVRSKGPATTDYLYWYCRSAAMAGDFGNAGRGVNIRHLGKQGLAAFPIPLPPRAEQEWIVAAIEEHISRLDAAGTAVSSARRRSELFIQRLIDSAWGGGNPAVALDDLLVQPLANGRSVKTGSEGFPVLRLTALRNRRIVLSERKRGAWTREEAAPFMVRRDDFLVSRGNGSLSLVGRGGLIDEDPDPVAYPDTLIRVRTRPEDYDSRFLSLVWDSTPVRRQIEGHARTTAGIYKVNQEMFRRVKLPMPPLDEQMRIVGRIEAGLATSDRLGVEISRAQLRAASLRRSILAAAFSGQLVPQDPDDEPASVLLARIRAERVAAPTKRGRKAKAP